MKSLINNSNSDKKPFQLILFFIFIYICPNTTFLNVGENSFLPIFIFLLGFSFFKEREIYIFIFYGILSLIYPLYSSFFVTKFQDYSVISSLMSLYLYLVPAISSIALGRIIGSRFSYLTDSNFKKEFKLILFFIGIMFLISALLKIFAPSVLFFFLNVRTTYGRFPFFFTEPSQASSFLLLILYLNYFLFKKNNLTKKLFPEGKKIGLIILFANILLINLIKPLTLYFQILLIFIFYGSIISLNFLKDLIVQKKLNLSYFGLKNSSYSFIRFIFLINIIALTIYIFLNNIFDRLSSIINISSLEQLFINFSKLSGYRIYFAILSLAYGFLNPLSIPGDWISQFRPFLLKFIDFFNTNFIYVIPDPYSLLQLYKTNPLLLKPQGWLYFSIFDLGIIGFLLLSFFIFNDYIKFFIEGIKKCNHQVILLFAIQSSLLIIPLLPSTPSVFGPLLVYSMIFQYKKNKSLVTEIK